MHNISKIDMYIFSKGDMYSISNGDMCIVWVWWHWASTTGPGWSLHNMVGSTCSTCVSVCSITELWREQQFYNIRTHVVPAARSTGVVPSCYPHFHTGSPPGFPSICYTRSPRAFQLRRFTSEHCSAMFLWIVKSKWQKQRKHFTINQRHIWGRSQEAKLRLNSEFTSWQRIYPYEDRANGLWRPNRPLLTP